MISVQSPDRHSPHRPAPDEPVPWSVPATLIACMCVSILSTDLYTPSLPHLTEALNTDPGTVQMTISANFIGYALGPFIIGPLADRFGRRPVLSGCMVLFALFSLLCAVAPTIGFLIAARYGQGAAASVVSVLGVIIIRDLYKGAAAVRVLSIYGAAVGVAPALGPLIGGWIHVLAGWRANFHVLMVLGLLVAWAAWRFVPETGERTRLDFGLALRRYGKLLDDRQFLCTGLAVSAIFGGLFAYITAGPFLFIEHMDVPTERYGYYYAAGVMAYISGAAIANRLAGRTRPRKLTYIGIVLSLAGAALLFAFVAAEMVTPLSVVAAMGVFSVGLGLTFSAAPLVMLARVPTRRGAAAGVLFGAGQSLGAALGAYAMSFLHDGTARPLAWMLLAFTVAAGLLILFAKPVRRG